MADYTIYLTEELAKKAVEKGYPGFITTFPFAPKESTFVVRGFLGDECYYFPTAEQVCGWLREEKGLHIHVCRDELDGGEIFYVGYLFNNEVELSEVYSSSYPECMLKIINEALDIITEPKKIPFNYKDIDNKSKEKYPEDVWNRYAFKAGATWAVENIFKDMTREEIIKEMGIPTITLDEMETNPKKEI